MTETRTMAKLASRLASFALCALLALMMPAMPVRAAAAADAVAEGSSGLMVRIYTEPSLDAPTFYMPLEEFLRHSFYADGELVPAAELAGQIVAMAQLEPREAEMMRLTFTEELGMQEAFERVFLDGPAETAEIQALHPCWPHDFSGWTWEFSHMAYLPGVGWVPVFDQVWFCINCGARP